MNNHVVMKRCKARCVALAKIWGSIVLLLLKMRIFGCFATWNSVSSTILRKYQHVAYITLLTSRSLHHVNYNTWLTSRSSHHVSYIMLHKSRCIHHVDYHLLTHYCIEICLNTQMSRIIFSKSSRQSLGTSIICYGFLWSNFMPLQRQIFCQPWQESYVSVEVVLSLCGK